MNRSIVTRRQSSRKLSKRTLPIDQSFFSKKTNSLYHKKTMLVSKFPNLFMQFDKKEPDEIKKLYKSYRKKLIFIDCFASLADLTVVTWLYFNHFNYNKHGYKTNKSDNIQRIICLIITVLVIISIIWRYICKKTAQNYKYLLSLRGTLPSQKINLPFLIFEVVIHCIQPYPGISSNFKVQILGTRVTYSLDMILFALSLLRLYVILKIMRIWNPYTNSRSQKISEFFGNKEIWFFLYRTNLKRYGFITVSFIMVIILFVFGYIFKIFENYQQFEYLSSFGRIWNCLWFLLQTMTTIGFGDYVPDTLIGRVIAIFLCFAGIFLQSLFTVSLLLFISIVDEEEQKCFAEINLLYAKEKQNNSYNTFFNNFIKYKFRRICPKRKTDLMHKNKDEKQNNTTNNKRKNSNFEGQNQSNSLNVVLERKSYMKVIKEKYYLRVLASLKIPLTISDFCFFVKDQWEPQNEDTLDWYRERNDTYKQFNDLICSSTQAYYVSTSKCLFRSNQLFNLNLFIFYCGPIFPIESYKLLKCCKVISRKSIDTKMKEFHVKFYSKKEMEGDESYELSSFSGNRSEDDNLDTDKIYSGDSEMLSHRDDVGDLDESYYSDGNSFIDVESKFNYSERKS